MIDKLKCLAGYRRSIGDPLEEKQGSATSSPEPTRINNEHVEPNTNGINHNHNTQIPPQPAPRKLSQQNSETSHKPLTLTNSTSSENDDAQVLPKPITNEEFQAMIPEHFLHPKSNSPTGDNINGPTVTVTINRPDKAGEISFPPAPTTVGKVTEVITKSTFTETVVTRVTDNKMVLPLIIEVSGLWILLMS